MPLIALRRGLHVHARKAILLTVSAIFGLSGFALLLSPVPLEYLRQDPTIYAHLEMFTVKQIAWVAMMVSVASAVLALKTKTQVLGYAVMQFFCVFWGALYLVSWMHTGYWRAVFPSAQYMLIAFILYVSSRLIPAPTAAVAAVVAPTEENYRGP